MTFNAVLIFSCILLVSVLPQLHGDNVYDNRRQDWLNAGLTPYPIQTLPQTLAEVIFKSGAVINIGKGLTENDVADAPISIAYPYSQGQLFTFMMFDAASLYCQWLSVNNPGQGGNYDNVGQGQDLLGYEGPRPAPGSGRHRYVVLIFQQSYKLNIPPPSRLNFHYLDFTGQYNMQLDAGNFFDIYV